MQDLKSWMIMKEHTFYRISFNGQRVVTVVTLHLEMDMSSPHPDGDSDLRISAAEFIMNYYFYRYKGLRYEGYSCGSVMHRFKWSLKLR